MCGIMMAITNSSLAYGRDINSFMTQALEVGVLRGRDSTGLIAVSDQDRSKAKYYKKAVTGRDFLDMKVTRELLSDLCNSVLIGHNRAATKGQVTSINAHPFVHGNIIGVHNGTLKSNNGLTWEKEFEVDSEAIMYSLSVSKTEDIIPKLDGAFALIWYNLKEQLIHIVRNSERTLYYGIHEKKNKKGQNFLCASEADMLRWLSNRNHIPVGKVKPFEVGVEYIIDPKDPTNFTTVKHDLYTPPKVVTNFYRPEEHITPKFPPAANFSLEKLGIEYNERYDFWLNSFTPYKRSKGAKEIYGFAIGQMFDTPHLSIKIHGITDKQFEDWKDSDNLSSIVISLDQSNDKWSTILLSVKDVFDASDKSLVVYKDHNNKTITRDKWEKLTGKGCINCLDNLSGPRVTYWTDVGDPLCHDCNLFFSSKVSHR